MFNENRRRMMHDLATVSVIQDIRSIEGKDRIVLATVENYHSIIQKDQFRVGDRVIYIYYDAILPEKPEFEFLRKRCWSEKYKGFRIRPMKMGGEVSEGLVMPLSILPGSEKLATGTVVTTQLGIRRYDPEESVPVLNTGKKWWMKYRFIRWLLKFFGIGKPKKAKGYPKQLPKSDEENIEKIWDRVRNIGEEFIITEKMEGSAAMYLLDRKGKVHSYSHNWEVGKTGIWGEVASSLEMERKLKVITKAFGRRIAIQGEICGPGIQKNIYHFPSYRFFLYGAYFVDDGKRLAYTDLEKIASLTGLEMVPFIRRGHILDSVDGILSDCEGHSVFGKDIPREGLVWRTEDGKVHFKAKSRSYKVWFS